MRYITATRPASCGQERAADKVKQWSTVLLLVDPNLFAMQMSSGIKEIAHAAGVPGPVL